MRSIRLFVPVFLAFWAVSCTTTPVSPSVLVEAAIAAVPDPVSPEPLSIATFVEPIGLRWTLSRAKVATEIVKDDGRTAMVDGPAADSPLGLVLGGGLFLDAANNLSLLPEALVSAPAPAKTTFAALPTTTVWSPIPRMLTIAKTNYDITVSTKDLFGVKTVKVDLGLPTMSAMGMKVTRNKEGAFTQVPGSFIDFLIVPVIQEPIDQGMKLKLGGIPPVEITYTTDGEVLRSSDGKLRINRLADHLQILFRGERWSYYRGEDSGLVINEVSGAKFAWKKTGDGLQADKDLYWKFLVP